MNIGKKVADSFVGCAICKTNFFATDRTFYTLNKDRFCSNCAKGNPQLLQKIKEIRKKLKDE